MQTLLYSFRRKIVEAYQKVAAEFWCS